MRNLNNSHASEKVDGCCKRKNEFAPIWKRYCTNTSIHGMKYLVDKNMNFYERIIWLLLLFLAVSAVVYVSSQLAHRFSKSPLATVVESTIHPVSEIPYPAITICNQNRINWPNIQNATDIILPNATSEMKANVKRVLIFLNHLEYGGFEDLQPFINVSFSNVENMNLTRLYELTMTRCTDLFMGNCWWRNKYFPCCEIFNLQKSEYGLCFAFNSATNDFGQQQMKMHKNYPWRTNSYGSWSGLRFKMNVSSSLKNPDSQLPDGVVVIVNHPLQWPNNGYFVPARTSTSVIIKPTISYTTENVNRLEKAQRRCYDEKRDEMTGKAETLPNSAYLYANCISQCRQNYNMRYCNCSIEFFYPLGTSRACNIAGLYCMNKFDKIINYAKPPKGNIYFSEDEEGMECECLPECNRIDYGIEISSNAVSGGSEDIIEIDIHFQSGRIVIYRTDITFTWLDLMVGFGGIAGLFLGSSLLSAVEVLYYLLLGIYVNLKLTRQQVLHHAASPKKEAPKQRPPSHTPTAPNIIFVYPKDYNYPHRKYY